MGLHLGGKIIPFQFAGHLNGELNSSIQIEDTEHQAQIISNIKKVKIRANVYKQATITRDDSEGHYTRMMINGTAGKSEAQVLRSDHPSLHKSKSLSRPNEKPTRMATFRDEQSMSEPVNNTTTTMTDNDDSGQRDDDNG